MKSLAKYVLILLSLVFFACQPKQEKKATGSGSVDGEIIVFHAGSLSVPFQQIARQFEAEYPGTRVLLESAGSVASARKITDLGKPCDIMASADYQVIEELLIPDFASWHLPFVSNVLVIAYNDQSRYGGEITPANWMEILRRDDVAFGRSDPDSDPCGYRTLMTFQLADQYYRIEGLSKEMESKDRKYIRPKEVDLLALLEISEIDYIFIYKSVAVQHGLNYLELPADINLGDPALNDHYGQAIVPIRGGQPGQTIDMKGEAMIYSVTIPDKCPNPMGAQAFISFLLDAEKGLNIMEASGQNSVVPAKNKYYEQIPEGLKKFALPPE